METYEKIDNDTLKVTCNDTDIHIFEENRAELETQLHHLKLDKEKMELDYQNKIDVLETKLAILNA